MNNTNQNYAMGRTDSERKRLEKQSELHQHFTERMIENAGIKEGMRVLDLGCGAGNVTLSVSKKVGPTGQVVGVDMNPEILKSAKTLLHDHECNNATFINGNIDTIEFDDPFDAIIGRLVLMYLPDPIKTLKHVMTFLKPQGIVCFQELDMYYYASYHQRELPVISQLSEWLTQVFKSAGANTRMGMELPKIFVESGLEVPYLDYSALSGYGDDWSGYQYVQDTFESVLPLLEKFKIASAEEVNVDSIAQRLQEEVMNSKQPLVLTPHVCASARACI